MNRFFVPLLLLTTTQAFAQSRTARADFFTANGTAYVYATGQPGTYTAAYATPAGGRVLQQAELSADGAVRWPVAAGTALPAFVLCREAGQAGAAVWPLGTAEFQFTGPTLTQTGATNRLNWRCSPRDGAPLAVEVWRSTDGGAYRHLTTLPAAGDGGYPDEHRTSRADVYELRVVSADGAVRWAEKTAPGSSPGLLTLYPNPATGAVTLRLPGRTGTFWAAVLDRQGRTVCTTAFKGEETAVSLEGLAPGSYTVRVQDAYETVGTLPLVKH